MRSAYVNRRLGEIDSVIAKTQESTGDPEISSFLARFLSVFICGVYEDCVEHLFIERARKSGDNEVAAFMTNTMDRTFRNPTYQTISDHLRKFNPEHSTSLRRILTDDQIRAIDSIKTNKDQVAHGQPCAATILDISGYHSRAKGVLEAVEKILGL